jgi:hypothetical protein
MRRASSSSIDGGRAAGHRLPYFLSSLNAWFQPPVISA